LEAAGESYGLATVGCFVDDFDVGLAFEQCAKSGTQQRLVVRDQDTDHGRPRTGSRARTR
jgi:hypothetical protein